MANEAFEAFRKSAAPQARAANVHVIFLRKVQPRAVRATGKNENERPSQVQESTGVSVIAVESKIVPIIVRRLPDVEHKRRSR